jgi:integrase
VGNGDLIWNTALAQKYVDATLPKPKLPRRAKKRAKFYTLGDVAKIIAASKGEDRVFYWLAAETGLRAGEIAGLKLTDIDGERLTVNRSVWAGKDQSPKTNYRSILNSSRYCGTKSHGWGRRPMNTCSQLLTGGPVDMNVYRHRKMTALLKSLGIPQAGFHAFRHFNVSLLDALRVPLRRSRRGQVTLLLVYSRWTFSADRLNGNGILSPDAWQVRR